ncbi:MAG: NCS2 family permease [Peptococcaceae bacterium]|nr:NCS2 family permease [Peptococcaceae bacterium]
MEQLENFFGLKEKGTTVGTEVRAGTTTFMTMAYIAVVQPLIMSACGMPWNAVFAMTVLFSGLATIFMGLKANFPFAIAPGMGTNAIFAFSIVNAGAAGWETALGMIFWAGMGIVIFSIRFLKWTKWLGAPEKVYNLCIRESVVKSIPSGLQIGFGAAIGAFLLSLGLGPNGIGLVRSWDAANGPVMTSVSDPNIIVGLVGIAACAIMFFLKGKKFNVRGAILICILAVTAVLMLLGLAPLPAGVFSLPSDIGEIAFKLDISGALKPQYVPFILVFFLNDIFSTTGTALSCVGKSGLNKDGKFDKWNEIFFVDALAAPAGAVFGLTTPTCYVESAAGVADGGKTGLASVTTGVLFLLTMFLSPIFISIPAVATGVALVIVGLVMFSSLAEVDLTDVTISVPLGLMIFTTLIVNDFASAMCIGLAVWVLMAAFCRFALKQKEHLANRGTQIMAAVMLVMSVLKLIFTI